MTRMLLSGLIVVLLSACGGAADNQAVVTPSAIVGQQGAVTGDMPEIVVAYGDAAATAATSKTLTLPFDGSFASVDAMKGQAVHAGQRLATFSPSPAAAVAIVQARTALDAALVQRDRTARLLAQQLSTRDQLALAEKALADARAQVAAQGVSGTRGTVELRAPFDGTVLSIGAARGEIVQAGAPLFIVVATDGLAVTAGLEAHDMQRVHDGDAVVLTSIGGGDNVTARVTRVGDALDPATRQVPVSIAPNASLVPGLGYRAEITVGMRHGWTMPSDAIVGEEPKRHVFQIDHGKARGVPVAVAIERDGKAVVEGNLDPAQPLVTTGATQLVDGMEVRPMGKP